MPKIRAFQRGDEAGIRRLFETCHRRPLPADVWAWRYAPQGDDFPVTTVASDGEEIVGHVSALPARLRRGADRTRAGLWVDLMVAPRHRNLSLFLDMAEDNRRFCASAGLDLLFAFPNGNSFPVLKRMLGWEDLGDILALEAPLDGVRLASESGKPVRSVDAFGPEFDELWARLRPNDRWCGERGAARLNWRYRGRPRAAYPAWATDDGFVVVKTFDGPSGRVGDVLDFWFESEASSDALIDAALAYFKSQNVSMISAWALEGTPQRAALEALGLAPKADRTHFAGRWTADDRSDFPARHLDWSLSKGDSDVF